MANVNILSEINPPGVYFEQLGKDPKELFQPFEFTGCVSTSDGSSSVPVSILRDTASTVSLMKISSIPFLDETYTGYSVVIKGVNGISAIPLCKLYLTSDLMSKPVIVGVQDTLPVEGVDFLLGNDIAGSLVVPNPVVCSTPLDEDPAAEVGKTFEGIFPSCAVTRSQVKSHVDRESDLVDAKPSHDLDMLDCGLDIKPSHDIDMLDYGLDGLFDNQLPLQISDENKSVVGSRNGTDVMGSSIRTDNGSGGFESDFSNVPVTREMLIKAQNSDLTLRSLFARAINEVDSKNEAHCYYIKSGVLMRKFRPPDVPANELWSEVHQILVPSCYRTQVLSLAHDFIGGHLGVKKTLDKVRRYFYWPGVSSDVTNYCKTCVICQVAGKPNQVIPPAPLCPIPVVNDPFARVLIDCVGPLPKTKSGNQFMLTIMCATTRYPEAIPLRRITAKVIVPALIKFFTQFGLPRELQSDQGSNFTSGIFKKVMNTLGIKQYFSTAYHPESQGALERFHQTLKSMLTKYCIESNNDWDVGIPFLLYAVRCTKQSSLGYSPNELLFGRDTRGPLTLLHETWCDNDSSVNINEYVMTLKERLKRVNDFARDNLLIMQDKMKVNFDKDAVDRNFDIGDKVLLFLPVRKFPLQAKYQGPFEVVKRVGEVNYVISTPGRRKSQRLVHVNLLKKYHQRKTEVICNAVIMESESRTEEDHIHDFEHKNESSEENEEINDFGELKPEVKLNNSDVLNNPYAKLCHLSQEQQHDIVSLLQDYQSILKDVPQPSPVVEHDVVLIDNATPVRQAPYRMSPAKEKLLRDEVQFLLDNGLAEPSQSEWASPCVLVSKTDGGVRMCTDFRKPNMVTRADCFPLARIDDIIDAIGDATYITKLDLLKGYYQVPLTERAKRISAFITPFGLFQYTVMPFGMRNAPPTFMRMMSSVIAGLNGVRAYLDDLVVLSSTWDEHISSLRALFERLHDAHLTVNLVKSEFGHGKIVFLGHEIGGGMVAPLEAKVEAIHSIPIPESRKALQRFLGMVGYYRRFCPNFSDVAKPLTDLISPKVKFIWSDECQNAFEKIKSILVTKPVLKGPDFDKPFIIHVDASDVAAGAVLLQTDSNDILLPVCYMSTKFKSHQRNYSTIEKEAAALLMALEKFEVYLGNSSQKIIVYSDHNPLQFVNRMKNKNQRLTRWSLALQPYNLEIRHIKGKDNVIADTLSRPC